jgi:peptide chain release factor 2
MIKVVRKPWRKKRASLENTLMYLMVLQTANDAKAMLDLAVEADDESLLEDVQAELDSC